MEQKNNKLIKAQELLKEESELLLQVFSTPPGKQLLKLLIALFYDRPSYIAGDTHGTAFKEGQRDVVGYLKEQLENAEEEAHGRKHG